jgi:hypothetical protein
LNPIIPFSSFGDLIEINLTDLKKEEAKIRNGKRIQVQTSPISLSRYERLYWTIAPDHTPFTQGQNQEKQK